MKEGDLYRAVAKATGESISYLRRVGFILLKAKPRRRRRRGKRNRRRFSQQSRRADL